ncbi:Gfo/Idh/MocA family protein [Falsiroseomonas oryziterrae]|uniref:Gfo/Idh/MocA family protein n=1 Tax=Falsiroseomonas oryziterrae TaxID=2911368 RepID=UPI001F42D735|nr:Gfo/Idh/MocA family oxidoreductase [Roseomonas sp. NPKOSM-4]
MSPLRLGVAGLGRAFMLMWPTLAHHPRLRLVACADPRPGARARFVQDIPGAAAHETVEALCADPEVEAIYLATPHQHHATQAIAAARAGKHVLVEKPMAVTLAEAEAMASAHARAGTVLMIGHSHGQDGPVRHARRLIAAGRFGAPRLIHALAFTDFLWRPRRPEELDTAQGGGVVFSQAAHQLDVVRVLCGGRLHSVRAQTMAGRGTEGAYAAWLAFEGGAATATYSGFGRFDSDVWMGWIGELGTPKTPTTPGAARARLDTAQEGQAKLARAYGAGPPGLPAPEPPAHHNQFGLVLVQCERADLRLTPDGVEVHDDDGLRLERTPLPALPRAEVPDAFVAAIRDGVAPAHDGAWGLATLEACLALLASAREGREVALHCQTRFRDA